MTSFLSILENHLFSGVPSNMVWDLIKLAWEKANRKTLEELFIDAFLSSVKIMRPIFSKYADGEIELDPEELSRLLHQDLRLEIDTKGLSALTNHEFSETLANALAQKQILIIGGHNISKADYSQLVYNLVGVAESIFRQSVIENELAFRHAVLTESEDNIEAIHDLRAYLSKRFEITLAKLDDIEQELHNQSSKLDLIANDLLVIKDKLGIDRPEQDLVEEIEAEILAAQLGPMFEAGGLCSGYLIEPHPNHYFIAQEFSPDSDDLRGALSEALAEFDLKSIRADDSYLGGPILCKISALIQSTRFGIYQLTSSQNRNVYLELGIAIGLRKPFILVTDHNAEVATLAQGLEYFPLNSYLELCYELGGKVSPTLAGIAQYKVGKLPITSNSRTAIIAHGGGWDAVDFSVTISALIQDYNLTPVFLSDPNGKITYFLNKMNIAYQVTGISGGDRLDETVSAIQSARLGIYRIDKDAEADNFIALGIALGLNRPGLLVYKSGLPSDVRGLSALKFVGNTDLKQSFPNYFEGMLKRYNR